MNIVCLRMGSPDPTFNFGMVLFPKEQADKSERHKDAVDLHDRLLVAHAPIHTHLLLGDSTFTWRLFGPLDFVLCALRR